MTASTALNGVLPLVPTPFHDDDTIDETSLRRLVDHYVAAGCHGLTLLGVASEVLKLDDAERNAVLRIATDQLAGRLPFVVGTGFPSTRVAVRLSQQAEACGAAGVLVLPPYAGLRPGADELVNYFGAIAASVSIPVVVLDEPSSSLVDLPVPVLRRVGEAGVRAVKVEAVPVPPKFSALGALGIELYGGSGGMYFYEELELGSRGAMTGFGFIEVLVDVYNAFVAGEHSQAAALFDRFLPAIRYEVQAGLNLPLRKQVLQWRGIIDSARVRAPADKLDPASAEQMRRIVGRVGLQFTAGHPYAPGHVNSVLREAQPR